MYLTENLQEKWQPVLEHPDLPKIEDAYKRAVTTVILENQEKSVREDRSFMAEAAPANATGSSVDNFDPVLISLVDIEIIFKPSLEIISVTSLISTTLSSEFIFKEIFFLSP